MFAIDQPYTIALIASAVISLSLAVAVLMHKRTLGVHAFALLKAAIGMWAFASLFEVCSQDIQTKIVAYSAKYFFIVLVPIAWFVFGLYYSNRLRRLSRRQIALVAILPAVTLLLVATNRYHQWMFTSLEVVKTDAYLFIMRKFGPWFWVHAAYSYVLLFLGFFFMAKHLITSPSHYRWQVATLLVGGLTPWVANMLFTFKLMPYPYLDLTPFAFTISGLAFMIGIMRFQLLDVVPIAQDVVMEIIDDGIVVVDNENRVVNLNPAAQRLSDTRLPKLIGAKADDVFSWWPALKPDNSCPVPSKLPIIELNVDSRRCLLHPKVLPLTCNDRDAGLLITLQDVTNAMVAKEALRSSEERFRSLSENAPVIIFALEPSGAIGYLNPAFEHILGHDRHAMTGQPFITLLNDTDRKACQRAFNQLIQGEEPVADLNISLYQETGAKRLFNVSVAANIDAHGAVTGIVGLAKDITEEHDLQFQLFQSQKMQAVGTLAGGIAHDFNNLLMGMQANLSLMHIDQSASPTLHDKIKRIESQIQNGANLTRQLLDYARRGKYVITNVDLGRLIEDTLTVVQRTNKAITVQSLLPDEPIHINADRGQMELVLLNLFVNAADAMPAGGRLTVSVRHLPPTETRKNGNSKSRFCELMVADTGIGMDPATLKRIFEPFFTTKDVGRGTGLGLASVYGVIENHCGQIQVESIEGEGTTFTIMLPTAEKTVEKTAPARACALPSGDVNILLVEDEPLILKYCLEMVRSLNFGARAARNGQEAIDIYKAHHADIDLVILDMIMPGMDGFSVFKAIRHINPQLQVIITSGYATDSRIDEIISSGSHACLKKPYTREELADTIMTTLNARPTDHNLTAADPL